MYVNRCQDTNRFSYFCPRIPGHEGPGNNAEFKIVKESKQPELLTSIEKSETHSDSLLK